MEISFDLSKLKEIIKITPKKKVVQSQVNSQKNIHTQSQNVQAQNVQAQNVQSQNVQAQNVQAQNVQAQNVQSQAQVGGRRRLRRKLKRSKRRSRRKSRRKSRKRRSKKRKSLKKKSGGKFYNVNKKGTLNKSATNSKGWGMVKPKLRGERRAVETECSECFLNSKQLKYPYCRALDKTDVNSKCKTDCKGLLAGFQRSKSVSSRFSNRNKKYKAKKARAMSTKSVILGKENDCAWAKNKKISNNRCSKCNNVGHNQRTCKK